MTQFLSYFQEFGDSARARKLYEQDSDDDGDEELEINIKLEQGMCDHYRVSHNFHILQGK